MRAVVVRAFQDRFQERPSYLRLDGPFEYPSWTADIQKATPLPPAKASQWASCLKFPNVPENHPAQPRAVEPPVAMDLPSPPEPKPEKAPDTKPAPFYVDPARRAI